MTRSELTLTELTPALVPAVHGMEQLCFPADGWSRQQFYDELTNPLAVWLVALDGDTPVGYAGGLAVCDTGEVTDIGVPPAHRGRGIGRALLGALLYELRARGCAAVHLEVRESNAPARALYRSLGFREVGRRPRYYRAPVEDAILLTLEEGVTP